MANDKGIFATLATYATDIAPLLSQPARNLSDDDAFHLMMSLVDVGEITLFDEVITDKNGNITSHRSGMKTRIVPNMAGIPFLKASEHNNGPNGSVGAAPEKFFSPTPSFAIVLYKLARMLADDWDAKQIVYGGVGAGPLCHGAGRCVDFYGANTKMGNFDVRRDWWMRPVIDSFGNTHPSEGNGWGADRWKDETKTFYRFSFSQDPTDNSASEFFAAIYEFAHDETRAEAFDIDPQAFISGSTLGQGWIHHPDYPLKGSKGREAHNDHIHFQLGNTQ